MHRLARAALAALGGLAFGFAATASQAQEVGRTSALIPAAYQQQPQGGARSELKVSDPIIRNASLSTQPGGALEVTFLDGSKLSMGENSTVVVDNYVYSGPGGAGQQTLRYTQGLFRFVSGSIPKDQVKVETPTVTIGIRGTIFKAKVEADGSGQIAVDYGPNGEEYEVIIISKETGKVIILHSGQKVGVDGNGVFEGITDGTIQGCE